LAHCDCRHCRRSQPQCGECHLENTGRTAQAGHVPCAFAFAGQTPANDREQLVRQSGGSVAEALKLVNYGGLDILAAFDEVLLAKNADQRRALHKLADALSARGSDTIFNFFVANLFRRIEDDARNAALRGALAQAEGLASLSSTLREKVDTAIAYNLDRKQTIMGAVEDYLAKA
jgi:DNA polymerase III subunit delta'